MARGITWDKPKDRSAEDALRHAAKTAPGPPISECCECSATTFPQWHEAGEVFCSAHVPHSLRYPEGKRS